ncbi:MAG: hypothetical protein HYY06_27210 [Deltaproteobacteria bacterium]|nr:hypothetical protein [Deltaproteobacteria bacterium]
MAAAALRGMPELREREDLLRSVERDRDELVRAARDLRIAAETQVSLGRTLVAQGLHWRWLIGGLALGFMLGARNRAR